jgi:hypothetical protein
MPAASTSIDADACHRWRLSMLINMDHMDRGDRMSTLDPDNFPPDGNPEPSGRETGALGPSDSSDSGSDIAGAKRHEFDKDTELDQHALETGDAELASDTDRAGTGERSAADGDSTLIDDADIEPDRIDTPAAPEEGLEPGLEP